jgi:hypothetical protein
MCAAEQGACGKDEDADEETEEWHEMGDEAWDGGRCETKRDAWRPAKRNLRIRRLNGWRFVLVGS